MQQIRAAHHRDIEELKHIWMDVFGDSQAFVDWYFRTRFIPDWSACLEEDGRIVSVAHSLPVHVSIRGRIVRGALLNGVATLPEYGGRGYMGKVFAFLLEQLRKNGTVVIPHTPAKLPTYFSRGHLPVADAALLDWPSAPQVNMPVALIETEPDAIADKLYAYYTRTGNRYSGMLSRSYADFLCKLSDYHTDDARCIALIDTGILRGYAIYMQTDERLHCPECFAENDAAFHTLVDGLCALANGRALSAKLPPDAPCRLGGHSVVAQPKSVMGVANVPALLAAIMAIDGFSLEISDPVLPQNNGVFDLRGTPVQTPAQLRMPAGRLVQWITGYQSLHNLAEAGHIQVLDTAAMRTLDDLFPTCPCFIVDEY